MVWKLIALRNNRLKHNDPTSRSLLGMTTFAPSVLGYDDVVWGGTVVDLLTTMQGGREVSGNVAPNMVAVELDPATEDHTATSPPGDFCSR
eukprot:4232279-Amphidinium_carterae.1